MTCERCQELEQEVAALRSANIRRDQELAELAARAAAWLERQGDQEGAGLIRFALLGERKN